MGQLPTDPCLLYNRNEKSLQRVIGLQAYDTLLSGTSEFRKMEDDKVTEFASKGRAEIGTSAIRFNDADISKDGTNVPISQKQFIKECYQVGPREVLSFSDFWSLNAQLAYVAFSTAPDVLVFVAIIGQITEKRYETESAEAMRVLRKLQ